MAKIIGGENDGGGFIITPNGIIPIPPWEPRIAVALDAVAKAVRFGELGVAVDAGRFVAEVVRTVSAELGVEGEGTLVYVSADGDGFTCGSTGRPYFRLPKPKPQPDPWRPRLVVEPVREARPGVIDAATAAVLQEALVRGADVRAFLQAPEEVGAKLGIAVPPAAVDRLRQIPLSDDGHRLDEVDQEIVALFNEVVVDGRFVTEFVTDPAATAERLGRDISPAAVERVREMRIPDLVDTGRFGGGEAMSPAIVAVAVAIVIVLWSDDAHRVVIDQSGIAKL